MALTQVTGPYPIFTDLDGTPLDDGYLYIGEINQDPEQNPIQVFWDANLTIAATQPIRTSNGYAYRNGTPALLYTGGEFSITIRNKREEFVLYSPVGYGFDPAAVSASVVKNDFIGNGVDVNFTLSASPSTILATNIFINGVYQEKDSYSLLGNVITFSIAPPLNSSIEIMTNETGIINSGNATAISYTASFAGATAQTVQTKLEQYVSVKDFGAVGDGTGDLGVALQAAHDALGPDGGQIEIPAGVSYYRMTTGVNFTKPISLVGDGWYNTEIYVDTVNLVCIGTVSKLDVQDISWTATGAADGTCTFIQHAPASANHGHSTIRNNFFASARYGYRSQSTNAVVLDNNVFGCGANGAGIWLENNVNPDIGDSFITNNTISGDATSIGILVSSTSGLNVCNNKFNSSLLHHALISVGANPTGNFLFSNNSFEGHTDAAIKLLATTGAITKTIITGNQFSSANVNHIAVGNNATNTVITGNTFNSTTSVNGAGIVIESGAKEVTITGNAFHQILNSILCASGVSAGITASGNRFANDVSYFFSGDDGLSTTPPQRELSFTKFISNVSDVTYVTACKVQGTGTIQVKAYGLVQGVGVCNYYASYLVSGGTPTALIAPITTGAAFDIQVANSAGYCVISAKRATGIGTSLTAYVEVTANGQTTYFAQI